MSTPEAPRLNPQLSQPDVRDKIADVLLPSPTGFTPDMLAEARERKVLQGRVYLVIGAGAQGIGGATAREFARQGANLVTSSRFKVGDSSAPELISELREMGTQALWLPGDIAQPNAASLLVAETVEKFGRLDGLVYAAGIRNDYPFFGMSDERMKEVFEVNYFGAIRAIQAAFKQMRKQQPPQGWITIVSSEASDVAPGQTNYGGAKAALNQNIRTIAVEIQAMKTKKPDLDISINAVSPGLVTTPLVADLKQTSREAVLEWTHADRELQPDEVGQLIVYLSSPAAEGLTGEIIPIIGKNQT